MAGLNETEQWEEEIYQWETTDPVVGGANGIDNVPTRQLANRTKWLKARLAELVDRAASILNIQKATHTSAKGAGIDGITAAFTPTIAALSDGMRLTVRAAGANTLTAPTFSPAAGVIAAKPIVKGNGKALVPGDIAGAAHWLDLHYDETLDKWILLNPATGLSTATAENNAAYTDNSAKPASTSWIRGAISVIAIAAGFSFLIGPNGYVRLPTWLGGFCWQWGLSLGGARSSPTLISFPTTFNSMSYQVISGYDSTSSSTSYLTSAEPYTASQFKLCSFSADSPTTSGNARWFAIGY